MGEGRSAEDAVERALLAARRPDMRAADALQAAAASMPTQARLLLPRTSLSARVRRSMAAIAGAATPSRLLPAVHAAVEEEWERGTPFLLVPVFLGIGAAIYFTLPAEPRFGSLLGVLALLIGAAFLTRHRPAAHVLAALALLALGMLAGKAETWRADTKVLGSEVTTRLTGRIVAIEHQARGRVRLTLDVVETARPKLRHAPARVRVSARQAPEGVEIGGGIVGLVRLMPPSGPVRPGSYDFAFENYFDGNGASGFFLSTPEPATLAEPAPASSRFAADLERFRNGLAARIRDSIGGPEGEIAAALITGVKAGIPEETNEAMRVSGLYHVLSISGLHLALVALTVMGSLRFAFALFPAFASRRPVKKYAAAAALATVFAYLYVSGASVATQRSFIMLAVMLVALFFDRAALTMRNLAVAATVIILVAPHEVMGPSFQMSFAATAALVAAYAAWSERKMKKDIAPAPHGPAWRLLRGIALYAGGIAVTSIVAGGATALFAAWHFHRVAPLGLLANLGAMPAVSLVVMPAAVFAMVLMPFGLEDSALWAMGKGIAIMVAVAEWTAARSPFDIVGMVPTGALLVLSAGLVVVTVATTRLRLLALPLLAAGALMLANRDLPDVLVSEDGRLVAVPLSDARLAVNRARPNAFTTENWLHAMAAHEVMKPRSTAPEPDVSAAAHANRMATDGSSLQAGSTAAAGPRASDADPGRGESGFVCDGNLCLARHSSGAVVAHAADAASAAKACGSAALIVLDDATIRPSCRSALTITRRDLARRGSAVVSFVARNGKLHAEASHAIEEPYRPWHAHRAFSREARGLPPYRRTEPAASAGSPAPALQPMEAPRFPISNGESVPPADPEP